VTRKVAYTLEYGLAEWVRGGPDGFHEPSERGAGAPREAPPRSSPRSLSARGHVDAAAMVL
jgi:hypothetical protein